MEKSVEDRHIESPEVYELITLGYLTSERANELTPAQQRNLTLPWVRKLIIANRLPVEQAIELTRQEHVNLESAGIYELINSGHLPLEQALRLTDQQCENLYPNTVYKLIMADRLPVKQALELTPEQCRNLCSPGVHELIIADRLSLELALKLMNDQLFYLESDVIRNLIMTDKLLAEKAINFTTRGGEYIRLQYTENLITKDLFTVTEALNLTPEQLQNLRPLAIRELIVAKKLPIQHAFKLTGEQRKNLAYHDICKLIITDQLSLDHALTLTYRERSNLMSSEVNELMAANRLSLQQALELTPEQLHNLRPLAIRELIVANKLPIQHAFKLTEEQLRNLCSPEVYEFITTGQLSIQQALKLTYKQCYELVHMLATAQKDFLETLIGSTLVTTSEETHYEWGIYLDSVKSYDGVDLGTKILYLEKSITQDCQTFLNTLDKLYKPELIGAAKEANLDFIRSLKTINDLFFNNKVHYDNFLGACRIYAERDALTHFFSSLGSFNPQDFKDEIRKMIHQGIEILSQDHQEEITTQKQKREEVEKTITNQSDWRNELDLPTGQRISSSAASSSGNQSNTRVDQRIDAFQHLFEEPSIRNILTRSEPRTPPHNPNRFFNGVPHSLSLEQLQQMIIFPHGSENRHLSLAENRVDALRDNPSLRMSMLAQAIIDHILSLVPLTLNTPGDSINRSPDLEEPFDVEHDREEARDESGLTRHEVFQIYDLLFENLFVLSQAITLTAYQYFQYCNLNSAEIGELIAAGKLTLERAQALTLTEFRNLHSNGVHELIIAGKLTLERALVLTSEQRANLEPTGIHELMTAGQLSLEQALTLTAQQCITLNSLVVRKLMTADRLSLNQALALTYEQRDELEHGNISAVLEALTQPQQATSSRMQL